MQMRQQRETLGKHAMHFLAGYISMFSRQGPFSDRYNTVCCLLYSSLGFSFSYFNGCIFLLAIGLPLFFILELNVIWLFQYVAS